MNTGNRMNTLRDAACAVLNTASPAEKARLTRIAASAWLSGRMTAMGDAAPPDRPARPDRPVLGAPKEMAKRGRGGSDANRAALFHALAHIELNAIDLAWDLVARRWEIELPRAFLDDWVRVADDEARHFVMLEDHMRVHMNASYGDLPAHDGLWQSAAATTHDLAARLAVVPMVLEARGLDVTPATVARLRGFGDEAGADILQAIYEDEIAHVSAGSRWFHHLAEIRGVEPRALWRDMVARYFKGRVKAPFNVEARAAAGFPEDYYLTFDQAS